MAGGFAKDGAVQDQIDATVDDAVNRARIDLLVLPQGYFRYVDGHSLDFFHGPLYDLDVLLFFSQELGAER